MSTQYQWFQVTRKLTGYTLAKADYASGRRELIDYEKKQAGLTLLDGLIETGKIKFTEVEVPGLFVAGGGRRPDGVQIVASIELPKAEIIS